MGIQELELGNNPLQCDCYEMVLRWLQQLQHRDNLRQRLFANSKIIGCMEENRAKCHTYYTHHLWSLNVPPFLKSKNAQDLYKRCNIYDPVEACEPRRFGSSPPMTFEDNELGEE